VSRVRTSLEGRNGDDSGAGTVLAVAMIAVVLGAAAALGLAWRAQDATLAAQTAADLAALAAAQTLLAPDGVVLAPEVSAEVEDRACVHAAEVARRNDAVLVTCVDEGSGVVTVRVRIVTAWGTEASARAGPGPR
jgi:uncharacterized protein HemX